MVLIDFGEFSHLLAKYDDISEAFENPVKIGHFWAKSMGYSPWFRSILGNFQTFWKNTKYFWGFCKICQNLAIFEQKAWAIAHGFDRFWGIFTPFGKIRWYFWGLRKSVKIGHFWAKSMGYSPWFWSILGNFHTFWKNTKYFSGLCKILKIMAIFLTQKHGL